MEFVPLPLARKYEQLPGKTIDLLKISRRIVFQLVTFFFKQRSSSVVLERPCVFLEVLVNPTLSPQEVVAAGWARGEAALAV